MFKRDYIAMANTILRELEFKSNYTFERVIVFNYQPFKGADWSAMYSNEMLEDFTEYHYIRFNSLENSHCLNEFKNSILHELVHAWQQENNLDTCHDAKFFEMLQKWCKLMNVKFTKDHKRDIIELDKKERA